jgi:hypothetical protein
MSTATTLPVATGMTSGTRDGLSSTTINRVVRWRLHVAQHLPRQQRSPSLLHRSGVFGFQCSGNRSIAPCGSSRGSLPCVGSGGAGRDRHPRQDPGVWWRWTFSGFWWRVARVARTGDSSLRQRVSSWSVQSECNRILWQVRCNLCLDLIAEELAVVHHSIRVARQVCV